MAKSDIEKWQELVEQGRIYKEKYGDSQRWSVYRNYGRGKFPGYTGTVSGVLPYNLTYAMSRALVPNVYFRNPYVNISRAVQPIDPIYSKILEATDNWLIQELNLKRQFKTAVLDAYYTNRGIIKLGYDSQYGYFRNTRRLFGIGRDMSGQFDKKGDLTEYNINVKPGMPWALRTMPDYIILPFGVRTLDDCPWIDHVSIRRLEDVKADKKYKNVSDLEGTHVELLYKDPYYADFYRELSKYHDLVEIHEIRNRRTQEIMAYVPGHDKWIRPPEEDLLQIEGLPFVDFTFNEDTEFYWGPSDVAIMEPQQLEINEARTQAMYHRRIALVKFLVNANLIGDDEIDKMMSENVGPVVKVTGDPKQVAAIIQSHIPPELLGWVQEIRADAREMMGFGRNQLGEEARSSRRTATEAGIVQQAHEIRIDERRDIVAEALQRTIRKLNQIIFSRWDTEKVIEVVGFDAARYWVRYRPNAIAGEYNIKVDVESLSPKTKEFKKREIFQVIQALAKHPSANIDHLLRLLLREYEWADAMTILPQAPETSLGRPMALNQFVANQRQLMQNPAQREARTRQNANMIRSMI